MPNKRKLPEEEVIAHRLTCEIRRVLAMRRQLIALGARRKEITLEVQLRVTHWEQRRLQREAINYPERVAARRRRWEAARRRVAVEINKRSEQA
jgi:hypothetical protein